MNATCKGVTKKGTPCKGKPNYTGNGYCTLHQDQYQAAHDSVTEVLEADSAAQKATAAVKRLGEALGGQGGRSVRLAISRRGKRPHRARTWHPARSTSSLASKARTRGGENDALHDRVTRSIAEYRDWLSPNNRAFKG